MIKNILLALISLSTVGIAAEFYYDNGQKVEVSKLYEKRSLDQNATLKTVDYYQTSTGHKVGVTNEVLVQCQVGVDCEKLLNSYDLLAIEALSETIYLVRIDETQNVFTVAQTLYADRAITLAHPNFIKEKQRR